MLPAGKHVRDVYEASVIGVAPKDAILIDCNRMELEESVSYLREIRALPHLRDTPIIASTSAVKLAMLTTMS